MVKDGQIAARPMMYLALSYDHRIIDGREAVTFLVRVKEAIEDPTRLLIDLYARRWELSCSPRARCWWRAEAASLTTTATIQKFHAQLVSSCVKSASASGVSMDLSKKLCACTADKVDEGYLGRAEGGA